MKVPRDGGLYIINNIDIIKYAIKGALGAGKLKGVSILFTDL